MRVMGIAAIATAAVLGSTGMSLTSHAANAHGGSGSAKSSGGSGGRASSNGGTGGDSTGGNGIGCGLLSGILSNDINNLLAGQNQVLDGANLLDNLFVPVLSPGTKPNQNSNAGGSKISGSRGGSDSASTGNAACANSGNGGNGGRGGSSKGGSGGGGGKASAKGGKASSKIDN